MYRVRLFRMSTPYPNKYEIFPIAVKIYKTSGGAPTGLYYKDTRLFKQYVLNNPNIFCCCWGIYVQG